MEKTGDGRRETGEGRQETVFRRRETEDYFYLFFPRNAHAVTPPHPTPHTPHPNTQSPRPDCYIIRKTGEILKKSRKFSPSITFSHKKTALEVTVNGRQS
ncbi:MAG: hypothetical protein EWV84_17325 [Microcystis sp. M_QC_C_20170808_M3Col]|nr:MAG: hypothetical protein EWV84_17325 [Microcystis sp. M_QC_C_20170808_M3Col]